jgi:hypothetical protein
LEEEVNDMKVPADNWKHVGDVPFLFDDETTIVSGGAYHGGL